MSAVPLDEERVETWVSIDVGIINLAMVKAKVWVESNRLKVLDLRCVDITNIPHNKVPRASCNLYHTCCIFDRMQHFYQEFDDVFVDADRVLIERQPLSGLVHVEQNLYGHYRSRAFLVSPNSVHKWLGIRHMDYDNRKVQTVRKAETYLAAFPLWREKSRKHDLADALCFLLFELHKQFVKLKEEHRKKRTHASVHLPLPWQKHTVDQTDNGTDNGTDTSSDTDTINSFLDTFKYNATR